MSIMTNCCTAFESYQCALSIYLRGTRSQRTACIDSRMLSTSIANPCQTLRELLVGDHEYEYVNVY